ncbi:prolyl oligopeptidase family serine peptidase [Paenibacillus sp. WLX2291]|uniref:prolyl oligopeptidase family serine peptidase n=1 Tax=Paenibacillus sp. WLX2291 TaxID=3296934 RepID=UPI003983EC74
MSHHINKKKSTWRFILLCIGVFIISVAFSIFIKSNSDPLQGATKFSWNDSIGKVYTDISYGNNDANKFDLYVPTSINKKNYGLVVYLHAGGFRTGDKQDDQTMLKWLTSRGYVAAGINYTLLTDKNPNVSVYSQSLEIKKAIPSVIKEAAKLGYPINKMAVSGGSAGGTLALIFGLRDSNTAPVPVKLIFEAVGPASFYHEDWTNYGLDQNLESAAGLFSVMSGKTITTNMIKNHTYYEAVKPISSDMWVNKNSPPVIAAYGAYDKIAPFKSSERLVKKLEEYNIPHEYIVFPHSGHGLQNDNKEAVIYQQKIEEYLKKYMPVE